MNVRVRTMSSDVGVEALGFTLAHEHIACAFGDSTGDPDLQFIDERQIACDLTRAAHSGVKSIVEVSTYDMRPALDLIKKLGARAGLAVIKSTGWHKSPTIDQLVRGLSVDQLANRMIADLTVGFEGMHGRAGLIGELGLSAARGTPNERRVLAAAAQAALQTGAAVTLHTDSEENAVALLELLFDLGLPPGRIVAGHMRPGDSLDVQRAIARAGVVLGFDQIGHPKRAPPDDVADRVAELIDLGHGDRIVLSSDVGRLSRLSANKGGGYISGIQRVIAVLASRAVESSVISQLTGRTIARVLAMEV